MRTLFSSFAVAIPLLVGLALFSLLGPFYEGANSAFLNLAAQVSTSEFPAGAITLITLIAIQIFVGVGVTAYAAGMIWTTPGANTFFHYVIAALLAFFLVGVLWFAAIDGWPAMKYSFTLVQEFFSRTPLGDFWNKELLSSAYITPLTLVYLAPGGIAALAVSMITLSANAQASSFFNSAQGNYGVDQLEAENRLRICLYLLAALLIISLLLVSTFLHLPVQLASLAAGDPEAELIAIPTRFSNELTTYWGVIFAMANLVAIGIPFILIHFYRRKLSDPLDGAANIFGFRDFFGIDFKTIIERLVLFASPVLAAHSSNFLNQLALFRPVAP